MNQAFTSKLLIFAAIAGVLSTSSCVDDDHSELDEAIYALKLDALPEVTHPSDNPTSPEKVALGKLLFWDPIVGGENGGLRYVSPS